MIHRVNFILVFLCEAEAETIFPPKIFCTYTLVFIYISVTHNQCEENILVQDEINEILP